MSNYVSGLVWRNFPGVGSELLVMLTMADWCNDDGGNLFPSVDTVAKRIRTSVSQARRVLHKLIAEEWLDVVGNKFGGPPGSTRRYRLNVARLGEAETGRMGATPKKTTTSADARDGSHGCEKTASTDESQDIKKQPSITINKTRRSPSAAFDVEVPDWINRAAWDGFVESRKRNPMTPRAAELVIQELAKLRVDGHDPSEVLDQSTRNSWRDVFPLKNKREQTHVATDRQRKLSASDRMRAAIASRHARELGSDVTFIDAAFEVMR